MSLVVSVHVGEGIGAVSQRSRLTVNRHESQLIAGIAAEVDGRAAVVADCNGALRVGGSVDKVFIGWSLTKHEELITSKETAGGAGIVSDVTFAL